jgi:hypothetical protein
MDEKPKISFGFKKQSKDKPQQSAKIQNNVEFITNIDSSTKPISNESKTILTIPLKEGNSRFSKINKTIESTVLSTSESVQNIEKSSITSDSDNLQKRAIEELSGKSSDLNISEQSKIEILKLNPDEIALDGGEEPTEDDFIGVPVEDFGSAMLRGMGGNVPSTSSKLEDTMINVRPRGMGLGAGILMKNPENPSKSSTSTNQPDLKMKKGSKVKILAGQHKDSYGTVEAFEECARVTVKLAIGGIKISINEYLASLVTQSEFDQKSKVLNNSTYESYKKGDSSTKDHRSSGTSEDFRPSTSSIHHHKSSSSKSSRNEKPQASARRRSRSKSPRRSSHHKHSSSSSRRRSRSRSPYEKRRRSRSRSPRKSRK